MAKTKHQKSRLSPLIPENAVGIKRASLVCISDFIYWLSRNKPEAFNEAMKAVGNDCKASFNDLDTHCELWK